MIPIERMLYGSRFTNNSLQQTNLTSMEDRLDNKYLKSELKVYGVYRGDLKRPLPKGWIERMGEIHSAHVRMLANDNEMSHVVLKRWQEVYRTDPLMSKEVHTKMSCAAENVFIAHAMFLKDIVQELTMEERATVEYFDNGQFNR